MIGAGVRRMGLVAVVAGLVGCGGDDDRPARWTYIQPAILAPSCATVSCHGPISPASAVRLDDLDHGYASLLADGPGDATAFVFPGDPVRSKLLHQLRATGTKRMPRDVPLPDADIDLIERWILAGATRD